jgi:hypothetical protein
MFLPLNDLKPSMRNGSLDSGSNLVVTRRFANARLKPTHVSVQCVHPTCKVDKAHRHLLHKAASAPPQRNTLEHTYHRYIPMPRFVAFSQRPEQNPDSVRHFKAALRGPEPVVYRTKPLSEGRSWNFLGSVPAEALFPWPLGDGPMDRKTFTMPPCRP